MLKVVHIQVSSNPALAEQTTVYSVFVGPFGMFLFALFW